MTRQHAGLAGLGGVWLVAALPLRADVVRKPTPTGPYVAIARDVFSTDDGKMVDHAILFVYSRKTGRIIWKRHLDAAGYLSSWRAEPASRRPRTARSSLRVFNGPRGLSCS